MKIKHFKVLLVITIFAIVTNLSFPQDFDPLYQGDLGIWNYSPLDDEVITVTFYTVSIPFEGVLSAIHTNYYHRQDTLQNGNIARTFTIENNQVITHDCNIHRYSKVLLAHGGNQKLQLGLISGNSYYNNQFGYAKHKIVIETNSFGYNKKYIAYFNTLDSRYGTTDFFKDFTVEYLGDALGVKLRGSGGFVERTIPVYIEGMTIPEFKVWELLEQPSHEEKFYARTSPFGISPTIIEEEYLYNYPMREYVIGTKILFDTVFNNFGLFDPRGYNTFLPTSSIPLNYYSNPPIPPNITDPGQIFTTPAWFSQRYNDMVGCKIIAENTNEITIGKNKKLFVSGNDFFSVGDTFAFMPGSKYTLKDGAQINQCFRGTMLDFGATVEWGLNASHHIFANSEIGYFGQQHTINNSGHIEVDGNGRLKIGDNTIVTFEGEGTYLKLNPNAIVNLGTNAKIEFKNGANFIANNSNIMTPANTPSGYGINLEDAGSQTSITNCTFNNLKNSIRFVNNNIPVSSELKMNIVGNTFYTNSSCDKVIETKNARNINILDNVINMGNDKGFGLLMRYPYDLLTEESNQAYYGINISKNTINDGFVSVTILGVSNAIIPINFIDNTLNSNSGSFSNFIGSQITGVIRNNHFNSSSSSGNFRNMDLNISVPNVINNTFSSSNVNIINTLSYPKLAPVMESTTDNGFIWVGGKNTINSTNNGNIQFYGGFATLDWGMNCFSKGSNAQYYMWDYVSILASEGYYMRQNSFNGNINPSGLLFNLSEYGDHETRVTPFFGGATFECSNPSYVGEIWEIRDLGDGLKDTIYKTSNTTGVQPAQDEMLYAHSYQEQISNNFFEAITYLKVLINNYPYSEYINNALSDLYTSYQQLDTSGNQNIRNILYNDLKNYLDNKILSGNYNYEFNYNAYDITLMCMANMTEYNEALSGYELIALYHPDPVIRLLASWDYAEIQALLNSSGAISGKEENMTNKEYISLLTKRVNSSIGEDPVKQKVFKSFKNAKKEMNSGLEKEIKTKTKDDKTARAEINRIKNEESKIDLRTISNIRYSKTQSKEEREKNQLEDLIFAKKGNIKVTENIDSKLPSKYDISQNYPNPFNPSTTIKYSLPIYGLVTIKIFDVSGREIKTLVNEIKQAGNYSIDFNGSLLSSGVYFYRIQSGDFVMTKRMVLIK